MSWALSSVWSLTPQIPILPACGPWEHNFQTSPLGAGGGGGAGAMDAFLLLGPCRPGGGWQPVRGIPFSGCRLQPAATGLRPGLSCGSVDSTHHLTSPASGCEVLGRQDRVQAMPGRPGARRHRGWASAPVLVCMGLFSSLTSWGKMQDDSLILDSSRCFGREVTTLPEGTGDGVVPLGSSESLTFSV